MTSPETPHKKSFVLAPPEEWLEEWIAPLWDTFVEIEQIYLLGDRARGPQGQKPDYSLLFYAGYDRALDLMTALAREEEAWRTSDGIIHLYVENYGATFCGIWGGALIPNDYNRDWRDGHDYVLWKQRGVQGRPLEERLRLPLERRKAQRRKADEAPSEQLSRDQLQPLWPADGATSERRRSDRRRSHDRLIPLLDEP